MAYNNANMLRIAQIGAMTRPQYRTMPTLDLGGAVDNFMNARDKSMADARRQAYADTLTQAHPEDAARIAVDPMAYAKMLEEKESAERDQQFKMDMLKAQFDNSLALENTRNANAVGLAKMRMDLENQNRKDALNQQIAAVEAEYQSGRMPKEAYDRTMSALKMGDKLYEIAYGKPAGANGSNLFGTTPVGNALTITSNPQNFTEEQVKWAENYLKNGDYDYIYNKSYNQTAGSAAAKQQAQDIQNSIQSQQQQQNLSEAINLVTDAPDNLFRPDAAISSMIGVYGGDFGIGMSPEDQAQYGNIERTVGSIENDLIAKARSKGQTGINTISEIRQAAKGLQLGRGKQRLIGALQAMKRIEERLDKMPTRMSVMPNNNLQVGQKIGGFTIVGVE